jgi:hypothetical protein
MLKRGIKSGGIRRLGVEKLEKSTFWFEAKQLEELKLLSLRSGVAQGVLVRDALNYILSKYRPLLTKGKGKGRDIREQDKIRGMIAEDREEGVEEGMARLKERAELEEFGLEVVSPEEEADSPEADSSTRPVTLPDTNKVEERLSSEETEEG